MFFLFCFLFSFEDFDFSRIPEMCTKNEFLATAISVPLRFEIWLIEIYLGIFRVCFEKFYRTPLPPLYRGNLLGCRAFYQKVSFID